MLAINVGVYVLVAIVVGVYVLFRLLFGPAVRVRAIGRGIALVARLVLGLGVVAAGLVAARAMVMIAVDGGILTSRTAHENASRALWPMVGGLVVAGLLVVVRDGCGVIERKLRPADWKSLDERLAERPVSTSPSTRPASVDPESGIAASRSLLDAGRMSVETFERRAGKALAAPEDFPEVARTCTGCGARGEMVVDRDGDPWCGRCAEWREIGSPSAPIGRPSGMTSDDVELLLDVAARASCYCNTCEKDRELAQATARLARLNRDANEGSKPALEELPKALEELKAIRARYDGDIQD